jgi:hypothetical protein
MVCKDSKSILMTFRRDPHNSPSEDGSLLTTITKGKEEGTERRIVMKRIRQEVFCLDYAGQNMRPHSSYSSITDHKDRLKMNRIYLP